MTSGVRISAMTVDAFRGISDPITFDFSSPITLIFAPNGTGKTTLCESAEWLLTGQVERLRVKKDFDPVDLKSKFVVDGRLPTVDARILVGDQHRSLSRVAREHEQDATIAGNREKAQRIGPNELLAFLAPAAAAQESHHLRAISLRQRWLRGTRFLSAEALAALVDSDDETIERRTQVFADLLGIRHLLEAEKQCDKFIQDLSARERSRSQSVLIQEDEIARLKGALDAQATRSAATSGSVVFEIEMGEQQLGIEADPLAHEPLEIGDRLERLSAGHGRRQHFLDARTSATEAVGAEWDARSEIEKMLTELAPVEARLVGQLSTIEDLGRRAGAKVSELTNQQTTLTEQARALATAKDALTQRALALAGALGGVSGDQRIAGTTSLSQLLSALPEAGWTQRAQTERRATLEEAIAGLTAVADEHRHLGLLQAQHDALVPHLTSEESLAILRGEAVKLEAVALSARGRLEAMSAPLERIQAASRDLLAHSHDLGTRTCPLCSYDWHDSKALRGAIAATLAEVPKWTRVAQVAATAASEAARLASLRLEQAMAHKKHAAALRSEIQAISGSVEAWYRALARIEVDPADPAGALRQSLGRLAVAEALAALLRERDRLAPTVALAPSPLLADATPATGLLEQLAATAAAREQVIQFQLATTLSALEEEAQARDRLRGDQVQIRHQLHETRERLSSLRPEHERLKRLWEVAAPGKPWTFNALMQARRELAEETGLLNDVAGRIAAARGAWDAEMRRARMEELTIAIKPMRDLAQHMRDRIAAASRARATFHQTYTDVSKRQIEDLSRVVNPLFARMHANRVFDRINLGQTSDALRWLADAGTQKLDPQKDFSQGQRQDLALALFLARARGLGGTFFLDEPVTHLDDLNRVGLLDIFRATVLESSTAVNLVITTASKALARHLIEKFVAIGPVETPEGKARPLRVIELDGNGRTGVTMRNVFPGATA